MTDEQFDPWKSLAAELGVNANEPAPPPPPTQAPSSSAPRPHSTGSSSPPPKKSSSDWISLAGELGIEVPAEPPAASVKRDPVAELLGFPPPPAGAPYSREERPREDDDEIQEKRYRDDDFPRDRWTSDDAEGGLIREIEESDDIARLDAVGDTDAPRSKSPEDERRPPRRRRRRGGRGRGEGRERDAEGRGREGTREPRVGERGSVREEHRGRPAEPRQLDDDDIFKEKDSDEIESPRDDLAGERPRRAEDDEPRQKRRRRRGRRGRGGSREPGDVRSQRPGLPKNEADDILEPAEISAVGEEIDFVELVDDDRTPLEPAGVAADVETNGDDELGSLGELHGSKNSVRNIMTWKEAIGMIIDGNMQARSRSPQSSQGSHGSHGSRGRGRGRGRGGHRGG